MLVENQEVEMVWTGSAIKKYMDKGYSYNGKREKFYVKVQDLSRDSNKKVRVQCDNCGVEYLESYQTFNAKDRTLDSLDYCPKCNHIKRNKSSVERRQENAFNKLTKHCEEFGYVLLSSKEEYVNRDSLIRYECPIHGEVSSPAHSMIAGNMCFQCGRKQAHINKRKTQEEVKNIIESFPNTKWLNPGEYGKNKDLNLKIRCECGDEYTTSLYDFMYSGYNRCKKCRKSVSKGEKQIMILLDSLGINYVYQKRFPDCRYKYALSFDFYLPDYNLIIEYDGGQHFNSRFFKTRGMQDYEDKFQEQLTRDNIKTKYCLDNGIQLLRIPYWQDKQMNNIILTELADIEQEKLGIRYSLVS